jgi:hypothetical protein
MYFDIRKQVLSLQLSYRQYFKLFLRFCIFFIEHSCLKHRVRMMVKLLEFISELVTWTINVVVLV